jgi:hypothetical protein
MYYNFNNDKRDVKRHLLEYLRLINADEKKHDKDVEMIVSVALENGMSGTDLKALMVEIDAEKVKAPENPDEKFERIMYVINLCLYDHYFSDSEKDFCVDIAMLYGIPSAHAPMLIKEIYNGIKSEEKEEEIKETLKAKGLYPA